VQQLPIFLRQLAVPCNPLFEGKTAESGNLHRAVEPVRRLAAPKVKIPVTAGEYRMRTQSFQFTIDDLERDTHADYAVLLRGRPVTAFMPLRFASAHRFLAAREIRFRPSAERPPPADSGALAGGFFAATRACTTSFARMTDVLAESRSHSKPRALAGHWSITSDSNPSTLFNRLRAFFTFITPPEDGPCYHRVQCGWGADRPRHSDCCKVSSSAGRTPAVAIRCVLMSGVLMKRLNPRLLHPRNARSVPGRL